MVTMDFECGLLTRPVLRYWDVNEPLLNLQRKPLLDNAGNSTPDNTGIPVMAIHEAAYKGCTTKVGLHLKNGTPADMLDDQGLTPLIVAAISGRLDTVQFLLNAGADVNFRSKCFGTALHVACGQGSLSMVNTLLCGGADCAARGRDNQTCLFTTALTGELEVVKRLLQDTSCINDTDCNGLTPLHAAVSGGHVDTAVYLIQCGASVSKRDSHGNLALHYAVKEKDVTLVEALINAGSSIDHMNTCSESPLHIAIRVGHVPTIWLLAAAGCNVNVTKPDGSGVLHLLVSKYHSTDLTDFRLILETLLLRGCDLNTVAYNTLETPLYRAIGLQKHDLAEMLMAYGADPNLSCPFDITALQLACRNESLQTVQMILHCGIDWKRERWLHGVPMSQIRDSQYNDSQNAGQHLLRVIFNWKNEMLSLQNLCRIRVRKHYRHRLLGNLDVMRKVPLSVKNFLLLTDISETTLIRGSASAGHVTRWLSETDDVLRGNRFSLSPKNSDLMEELHV